MPHFGAIPDAFSAAECDAVLSLGRAAAVAPGKVGDGPVRGTPSLRPEDRRSGISFLPHNDQTDWVYRKLFGLIDRLNIGLWRFEIVGSEPLQFTSYREDGFYRWHLDMGETSPTSKRKLSATLQLTEPSAYEGGELQIQYGPEPIVAPKDRGTLFVFPSYTMHRVSPVTRGERFSLVIWIIGKEPFV